MFNTAQQPNPNFGGPMMPGMMGGMPQGGYAYNPNVAMPQVKVHNNLTQEEINELSRKEKFSLQITKEDMLRAACNHRTADGTGDTLVQDPIDGSVTCQICGHKFKPLDPSTGEDEIKHSVESILNLLQTTKLLYLNMPQEAAREYFQIIPLIEKIPTLFDIAVKNFTKHEATTGWNYNGRNMGTVGLFNMLSGVLGGGMNYNPNPYAAYGQPYGGTSFDPAMNQPAQQMPNMPVGATAPNAFGNYGQPQGYNPGMANPALNNGYTPGTTGFQFVPGQQVPYQQAQAVNQPGSAAPAETSATTNGTEVNATATFNA